jgi:hypothetical protein
MLFDTVVVVHLDAHVDDVADLLVQHLDRQPEAGML